MHKDGSSEVNWSGMKGDLRMSSDLNHLNGGYTLDEVKIDSANLKGVLTSMTSDYTVQKTNEGLYVGQAGITVPSVHVVEGAETKFDLAQLKARSESSIDNGLFKTSFKVSFDKLLVKDKQYGPGLLEISIKNIDAAVLARVNDQVKKLDGVSDYERQRQMLLLIPEIPPLFSKGAGFEISTLKLTIPEGDIDGHLSFSLPQSGTNVNPLDMIKKIEGEGKLQVPVIAVKKVLTEFLVQKMTAQTSPQSQIMSQMNQDKPAESPADSEAAKQTQQPDTTQDATTAETNAPKVSEASPQEQSATSVQTTASSNAVPSPVKDEDKVQQATLEADKKLAALVQAKILVEQGQNYVIEIHLSEGKLLVNGQPFDPLSLKL